MTTAISTVSSLKKTTIKVQMDGTELPAFEYEGGEWVLAPDLNLAMGFDVINGVESTFENNQRAFFYGYWALVMTPKGMKMAFTEEGIGVLLSLANTPFADRWRAWILRYLHQDWEKWDPRIGLNGVAGMANGGLGN